MTVYIPYAVVGGKTMTILGKWLVDATRARGSAKALVYRDTYLSWRGLEHRVERRAHEFSTLGVTKGQWVGLMLGNVPDFAILALALSKLGAVVVPLDPTTGTRDLLLILEHAPLRALITRPRGGTDSTSGQPRDAYAPVVATPQTQGPLGKEGPPVETRRRLQSTLLTCTVFKNPAPTPSEAAVVLYTNDSFGEPKGILRTSENLEAAATLTQKALDITAEDRILTTVPLYHAYGFDLGFVPALKYGATLFLEDEVAPKRIVKLLREQEINVLPGTPSLYAGLAKLPTAKPLKIKDARYLSGGAPLAEAVADSFRERWGIRIIAAYHTTETGLIACDRKGTESTPSVGKPIDGVEVKVGEPKTKDAGPLWVRSKWVAQRSVGSAQKLMDRMKPGSEARVGSADDKGWFRTGDLGRIDKTGRIFLEGREDQLVKVDGKRVALGEVESCLESFPSVQRAQARVITDPLGGPMVVACVVVMGKVGAEEIIDHCAKNLAPYKVPRRIEFRDDIPI
ncbi:MAG: class I adenylate-forming enzyme family protein [Polyangia bacterium]